MGIRFLCPSGHKLNVKNYLAGKRAICPQCGAKVIVPDLPPDAAAESLSVDEIVANPLAVQPGPAASSLFDAASPSVVLEVAESTVIAPSAVSGLPESVFATAEGRIVDAVEPVAATSETHLELRRDQTRRNQLMLLVVLAMVVIILAGVLIWVLNRNATPRVEEEIKAATLNPPMLVLDTCAVLASGTELTDANGRA